MPSSEMSTLAARVASFDEVVRLEKKTRRGSKRTSNAKKPTKGNSTAVTWPHAFPLPAEFARAGFFYNPTIEAPDNVQCFCCDRQLDGWEASDDPIVEHITHVPDCAWAINCAIGHRIAEDANNLTSEEDPLEEKLMQARAATFGVGNGWPHEKKKGWKCKVKKMVAAGWCYDPSPEADDGVTCFYCKLSLDGWEPKDDPLEEHRKRSTDCPFFTLLDHHHTQEPPRKKARASKASSRVSKASSRTSKASRTSRASSRASKASRDDSQASINLRPSPAPSLVFSDAPSHAGTDYETFQNQGTKRSLDGTPKISLGGTPKISLDGTPRISLDNTLQRPLDGTPKPPTPSERNTIVDSPPKPATPSEGASPVAPKPSTPSDRHSNAENTPPPSKVQDIAWTWSPAHVESLFKPPVSVPASADLANDEKSMTVAQWIMHNATREEDRLRQECEAMIGVLEREGLRAMAALEALPVVS